MIRKSFVMTLHPGQSALYEERHNPIWPELEQVLKDHGVCQYSIFLHPDQRSLFAYAEIETVEQWEAIASTPVCKRWWQCMQPLMQCHQDGRPKTTDLKEVFRLKSATETAS